MRGKYINEKKIVIEAILTCEFKVLRVREKMGKARRQLQHLKKKLKYAGRGWCRVFIF